MNQRRRHDCGNRHGFAWLEVLLALAIVILLVQLVPSQSRFLLNWSLYSINPLNWSQTTWLVVNVLAIVALALAASWASIKEQAKQHFDRRRNEHRHRRQNEKATTKQRELAEERALYERMHEARKRRDF
ncbi:MAG: hypothetical protein AAF662_04440 [Pseudomonadota bacterium]